MTQQPHDEALGGDAYAQPTADVREPSIVDTILNLDEFLSGEIRLAEKTARFCITPDLEAVIDELDQQLALLVDNQGKTLSGTDQALGDTGAGHAYGIAEELHAKRQEYAAAMRSVRMRQLPDDQWQAFRDEHREAFATSEMTPERKVMLDQLLVRSAHAPAISPEQLKQLRSRVGAAVIDELIQAAWQVNISSGVSVPKSRLSLAVLKQSGPGKS